MADYVLFIVNPGSTSTKVALYEGTKCYRMQNIAHNSEDLSRYSSIVDQFSLRFAAVESFRKEALHALGGGKKIDAVVGIGGLLRPLPGGTYVINDALIEDLRSGLQGQHASNLGGLLAHGIAEELGIQAYVVDPVSVDELTELARISGHPLLARRSLSHALNIKAVVRRVCQELGLSFSDSRLVVAHLGGGISVAPVCGGRILDVNNANEMGPFSPERTGSLPVGDLVSLCFSGRYSLGEMMKMIAGKGGLVAYLGTNDAKEAYRRADEGDTEARLVLQAMAYQVGKEIGAMSTVLQGKVDAIVLTGGLANSKPLVRDISQYVEFIAPILLWPGEDEMLALAEGVCRVLSGEESAKQY